jgi:hypothetical protein
MALAITCAMPLEEEEEEEEAEADQEWMRRLRQTWKRGWGALDLHGRVP